MLRPLGWGSASCWPACLSATTCGNWDAGAPLFVEYPDGSWHTVGIATSIPGYVVLAGLSWAFFNHLCSGIRHFVLDAGAGYELDANKTWSVLSVLGGIVLTAAFWAILLLL